MIRKVSEPSRPTGHASARGIADVLPTALSGALGIARRPRISHALLIGRGNRTSRGDDR